MHTPSFSDNQGADREYSPEHHSIDIEAYKQTVFLFAMLIASKLLSKVVSLYTLLIGTSIVIGGEERFAAPGFRSAMKLPWAPESWGWWCIACGLVMAIGVVRRWPRVIAVGVFGMAVWSVFFALSFLISSINYSEANSTGMWVYGKDAVIFTILGVVLWSQPAITRTGEVA